MTGTVLLQQRRAAISAVKRRRRMSNAALSQAVGQRAADRRRGWLDRKGARLQQIEMSRQRRSWPRMRRLVALRELPRSLDARVQIFDEIVPFGATVPCCPGLDDPQTYVESQLLDGIVGDLSVDDVMRLSASAIAHLQQALAEAGFGSRPVQQKERTRMRVNERHRGNAPPMTFQPMRSTKKKRRDSKVRAHDGHGGRPSRKPRLRWNRDEVVY